MIDFTGKAVLVSGGGSGIGRACLDAFAKAGANIATIEIDASRAAALREEFGEQALVVTGDVTNPATVAALAEAVGAKFSGLDVLVNNVGDFLGVAKPFERHTDAEIEALYAINLRQIFGLTRAMLPLLRARAPGSSIISVSSIEGFRGIPIGAVYAAFKAGITGFTKSLAVELGPVGIRVNLIAPETTDTAQVPVSVMVAEEHRHLVAHWTPLGRFGTAQDSAGAVLFLASPLAAWITGTSLHVDGGALAAAGWYRDPRGMWTNMPVITGNGLNL